MSAFHYKAVLLSARPDGWEYRFFPDFLSKDEETGRFLVTSSNWKAVILEDVTDVAGNKVHYPARCISALIHKIRRTFEAEQQPPREVTHVA
jgi:hypothetical protein